MTSSLVSSTWTPPGQVPSARWAAKKPAISREDGVEVAGLAAALGGEGVAVHRVAGPHDRVAGVADGGEERAQAVLDVRRRPCG